MDEVVAASTVLVISFPYFPVFQYIISQQSFSTDVFFFYLNTRSGTCDIFSVKVLSWNFQGFLGKDTRDHLLYLNNLHHPDIIFICEKNQ